MLERQSEGPSARAEPTPAAPRIAVILPCLDESGAIGKVVADFKTALPTADIYVIDNGSTDGTPEVARSSGAQVISEGRKGKGNAVRRAFTAIEADVYVLADGDGTYDASSAPHLVHLLSGQRLDMVVGARRKTASEVFRSGHELGNRLFNYVLKALFGSEFKDIFSGFRVLSRRFVKSFPALSEGFEIETEMTVHAIQLRMPVTEVWCDYGTRADQSGSKLRTVRDGLRILWRIVHFLRQHRPLAFFGFSSGLCMAAGAVLFYPILSEYLATGLVPRIPTLMVSIGLALVSALLMVCGLVLDTTTRTQLEIRRLIYLNVAADVTERQRVGRD